jgi:hypothetical protein
MGLGPGPDGKTWVKWEAHLWEGPEGTMGRTMKWEGLGQDWAHYLLSSNSSSKLLSLYSRVEGGD